jgi:hypothetical protein
MSRKESAMKTLTLIGTVLTTLIISPSFAAAATAAPHAYKTGVLAIIFFGFSTIVIVAQLIPAIITIIGIVKGLLKRDTAI